MTWNGTLMYDDFAKSQPVPERVMAAIEISKHFEFMLSTHPHTGRMLAALAGGAPAGGLIGETGTGTGVGLAWMHSTAPADTQLVSIELDQPRAEATAELFADCPNVTVLCGDAHELAERGPFDMLVLDTGSTPGPLGYREFDPTLHLNPNGLLVKDDQWPMEAWPPKLFDGADCPYRPHWLTHPELFTTEVSVADGYGMILARRKPPDAP